MLQIQKTKGSLYILGSCVIYSLTVCLIKTISEVGIYQTTFTRFVIGLLILCTLVLTGRVRYRFTNWRLLFLRGLFGSFGVFITYIAIVKIGVSKGMVIIFSYPVFASLFGAYFLKEKLQWTNVAALGGAIIGLYLLVTRMNGLEGFFQIGLYECITMVGAVICGITVVIIRKLHETETSYEIFFAQCAVGAVLLMVPASTGDFAVGQFEIVILLSIGILATIGQLSMTQGYRYLPVKIASLLSMSELIFNYSAGIFIFNESLTIRAIIGSVLIFVACLTVLLSQENA